MDKLMSYLMTPAWIVLVLAGGVWASIEYLQGNIEWRESE